MLTFTNEYTITSPVFSLSENHESFLFFDIETTGLSADISNLYFIGCGYYKDNKIHTIQWFADSYDQESALLHAFLEFSESFTHLLHYNGNTFDIPYIEKKCQQFQINCTLSHLKSIDIYKELLPLKKILCLDNLRQKTIEQFFSIKRKDTMDGKTLIKVYGSYIKAKVSHNVSLQEDTLSLLLLHNLEDILGLIKISPLLYFARSFQTAPYIETFTKQENSLVLHLCSYAIRGLCHDTSQINELHKYNEDFNAIKNEKINLPVITCNTDLFSLKFNGLFGTLTISLLHGELKHFFENYKDYFYLPLENQAIHKSVAVYVDKNYRQKATKDTCFCKKTGCFFPSSNILKNNMAFQKFRKDTIYYYEFSDDFFRNYETYQEYLLCIFQFLKKHC